LGEVGGAAEVAPVVFVGTEGEDFFALGGKAEIGVNDGEDAGFSELREKVLPVKWIRLAESVGRFLRGLVKNCLDLALEGGLVHHAGMHVGDFAGAIDEQGYRHPLVHAELLC
jgi:hypothetical protein